MYSQQQEQQQEPQQQQQEPQQQEQQPLQERGVVTLFVGNVDYATDSNELRELFSDYDCTSIFLKRGYAFVNFPNFQTAREVVRNFSGYMFNGRQLKVTFAKKAQLPLRYPLQENTIHVGNLPRGMTEQTLLSCFEGHHVTSIKINDERNCFALVQLLDEAELNKILEKKDEFKVNGYPVVISKQIDVSKYRQNRGTHNGRGFPRSFRGRGRGMRGMRGRGRGMRGSFRARGMYRGRGFGRGRGSRGRGRHVSGFHVL